MCSCALFCFNDTATTEIYTYLHTLSLHDALPICTGAPHPSAYGRALMKNLMSASVLAVAIASLSSPAFAQEAPAEETGTTQDQVGLSDIIVTATKRSENLDRKSVV